MASAASHNLTSAASRDLDDGQLVRRAVSAHDAFQELVTRNYSRVYAAAYGYTGQRESAEEVAQEAFLRAYLHLETLENQAAFGGWVVKIARNLAHNWTSQVQVRQRLAAMVPLDDELLPELEDAHAPSPRDAAAALEKQQIVQQALRKLEPADRELVLLHYMEDVTLTDIARQLGVYPSTVSRRLDKSLAMLRRELGRFFTGAGEVLAPRPSSARRAGLFIAAAASLPATSKAALVAAAGAVPAGAASASAKVVSTQTVSSLSQSGGVLMATTKAVAIGIIGLCLWKAAAPESTAAEPAGEAVGLRDYFNLYEMPRIPVRAGGSPGGDVAVAAPAPSNLSYSGVRPTLPFWELASVEAEKCMITSPKYRVEPEEWACGGWHVGFWGDQGDSVEWQVSVPETLANAKIGVRYAYDAADYMRRTNTAAGDHVAHLYVDDAGPIVIMFSDTGGWNWYDIATAELPLLQPGTHKFRLTSPLDYQAANLDALSLFRGDIEAAPAGPLRPSVVATSEEQKIIVLASPNAQLVDDADEIANTYHQLLALMETDFDKDVQHPVNVHFVEPRRWDPRNGRAIKNQHGIYVVADSQTARAEWCWVLAEYMADPQVPRWFRESLCRTNGLLDWLPSLSTSTNTEEDVLAAELVAEADRFLADANTTCSRVEVVHAAVRARYGGEVFKKFWQELARRTSGDTPEGDGRTRVLQAVDLLDKNVLIQILSDAAGEDVAPLYRRWTGFAGELPIDPVVVTDERAEANL